MPVQPTAGKWSALIVKATAPRSALQTMLAIRRGEPNTLGRAAALLECADKFLAVTTRAAEIANAIDWAEQSEDMRVGADVLALWRRALDERMAAEEAAAAAEPDLAEAAGDSPEAWPWGGADESDELEAERMEMADAE